MQGVVVRRTGPLRAESLQAEVSAGLRPFGPAVRMPVYPATSHDATAAATRAFPGAGSHRAVGWQRERRGPIAA